MLKTKLRGQVTAEFIVIMALVSIVFLVIINFIAQERKTSAQSLWAQDAKDTAMKLAEGIDAVFLAGSGSSMNVTVPKRLVGGLNYTITVRPRLVSVAVPAYGRDFEWKYMVSTVDGSTSGLHLEPGTIVLSNDNGTVTLVSH
jgi:hypothetical protein